MLLRAMPLSRIELARYLRRTMSGVEWDLWSRLRGRRLDGFKFRRKALIGPYIVDFACMSARLVVEIGGEMYDRSPPSDAARAAWLDARGFRVVRFTPDDVSGRMDSVITTIRGELASRPSSRSISASRGPGYFRGRRSRWNHREARGP
jgi:very-short-patch-repair endonuclease